MQEVLIALISTTALLLGSPGPAPLALAATGATYGTKQGLPFLLGILAGLTLVIIGTAMGLSVLFSTAPEVKYFCQLLGAFYIGYIAFKIATAPVNSVEKAQSAPSFIDGLILNLINPKAYAAFLAIFSQFILPITDISLAYMFTGLICLVVASIVDFVWLVFGGLLKPLFAKPKQARIIRVSFALLMLLAVAYSFT